MVYHTKFFALGPTKSGPGRTASPLPFATRDELLDNCFTTSMATKLGAAKPLGHAIRLAANASARPSLGRQFTCTALRTKDVASQEGTPNMRHAQRPREYFRPVSIPLTQRADKLCSWWKAPRSRREPNRQIPRESRQPPHLRPIPPLMHAQIYPAILRLEG